MDAEPRPKVNAHFATAPSWEAAGAMLAFEPVEPKDTDGRRLKSIRIHVRDHRLRELAVSDRTFEAHYDGFVVCEARKGTAEARRQALDVSYSREGREALLKGHRARVYEFGPEPPPDDIDGRSPAVVTWHDGEMFYLIASGELPAEALFRIAVSMYS